MEHVLQLKPETIQVLCSLLWPPSFQYTTQEQIYTMYADEKNLQVPFTNKRFSTQ